MTSRLSFAGANTAIPMQKLEFKGQYSPVIIQREGGKKILRKETVSNYSVAACENIICYEVLNLFKISSLVLKQKSNHI